LTASPAAPGLSGEVTSMSTDSVKPWRTLTSAEKKARVKEILAELDRQELNEPDYRTVGEWMNSADYLRKATLFAAGILGVDGQRQRKRKRADAT
jgi:hypothetical protein